MACITKQRLNRHGSQPTSSEPTWGRRNFSLEREDVGGERKDHRATESEGLRGPDQISATQEQPQSALRLVGAVGWIGGSTPLDADAASFARAQSHAHPIL
eukprot:1122890-Rhodomonas_salina.1